MSAAHAQSYVELFCGDVDLRRTLSILDNVSSICDLGDPVTSAKNLRNLTGIQIATEWLRCQDDEPQVDEDEEEDRRCNPNDYRFYDYLRMIAGSIYHE
jgi:hypothetical protein